MNGENQTAAATDWDAAQYLRFEQERTQPSRDLAARIELKNPSSVLDIGCGPGNSTHVLRERFPAADILGVDSSSNMIEQARRQYPELAFDIVSLTPDCGEIGETYDVIFSNACLQWIPDHKRLFPNLFSKLNPGGVLAVQIPMTSDIPISVILREMSEDSPWKDKIRACREQDLFAYRPEEYYDILSGITEHFTIWQTSYMHIMNSCAEVVKRYCGSRLQPYLAAFSQDGKNEFLADVENRLRQYYRPRANGRIVIQFPRLFMIANA